MATDSILEDLNQCRIQQHLSIRGLANELELSHSLLSLLLRRQRSLTKSVRRKIVTHLTPKPSDSLNEELESFIQCNVHISLKTISTL